MEKFRDGSSIMAASDFFSSNFTWILAVVMGVVGLLFLSRVRSKGRKLPPGPRNWPIVGALFSLETEPDQMHIAFHNMAAKYGPIVQYKVGVQTIVVVSSAQFAEEVLKQKDREFCDRSIPMYRSIAKYIGFDGLVAGYSDYHSEYRLLHTISVQEFFTGAKLKSYEELRTKEMAVMVESILRQIENSKHDASSQVEVEKTVGAMLLNILLSLCVGKRFDSLPPTDDLKSIPSLLAELAGLFIAFNLVDCFPFLEGFDPQGLLKRMKDFGRRQTALYSKIVEDRRQERNVKREAKTLTESDKSSPNFVDVLLRVQEEGGKISDKGIMATTMSMISAGVETTSTAVQWALVELARNPNLLQRLQAEVDEVVGNERPVLESDLQAMPYLKAVQLEILRLYPVIPMTFPHVCKQKSTIGGYSIPEQSAVFVNLYTIGRDAKVWKDPEQFNPERFMGELPVPGEYRKMNGSNFNLLPFGSGRRGCVGYNLAIILHSRALATLVHAFDWEIAAGVSKEHLPKAETNVKLTLSPGTDLRVVATPRLSSKVYQSNLD